MKKSLLHSLLRFVLLVGFYAGIAFFFLHKVILEPGLLSGGDWGLPQSTQQMWRYFTSGLYVWSDRDLLGIEQYFLSSFPFHILIGIASKLGISGEAFAKTALMSAFIFPAATMYYLCRFFKLSQTIAILAGFLYMASPVFFNYASMGWIFVLYSLGILPIALIYFIRSVQEKSITLSLITGILYSLAMVQSQSFIWYPLVFLSFALYLIHDKKSFIAYIRSFAIIVIVFLLLNAYWYIPLFFGGGSGILNTKLGTSSVSLGTWVRLNPLNIIRTWGNLYNEQYENTVANNVLYLSFVLPSIAYTSLFFLRKQRLVYPLVLITFIPMIFYILGPQTIVLLPFSDLIRDIARFMVLSTFAYVILAALVLNHLWMHGSTKRVLACIVAVLLAASTSAFWMGGLYATQNQEYDVRLRVYQFSDDYTKLEQLIQNEREDIKILYLPLTSGLSVIGKPKFFGLYKGIRDVTASFSLKPGVPQLSDRSHGPSAAYISEIDERINQRIFEGLPQLLNMANIKYIVVRKNMTHPYQISGNKIAAWLKSQNHYTVYREWPTITVFTNPYYVAHLYSPQKTIVAPRSLHAIDSMISEEDRTTALIFRQQKTTGVFSVTDQDVEQLNNNSTVEFKKINPSTYRLRIRNEQGKIPVVFSEAYHRGWKLYPDKTENYSMISSMIGINKEPPISDDMHTIVNGYANIWFLDTDEICRQNTSDFCKKGPEGSYDISLKLEFLPQQYHWKALLFSALSFGFILVTLVWHQFKKTKYGHAK